MESFLPLKINSKIPNNPSKLFEGQGVTALVVGRCPKKSRSAVALRAKFKRALPVDHVDCSCRGENPNCSRCAGTGLYEPTRGEGLPRPSVSFMAKTLVQRKEGIGRPASSPPSARTPRSPRSGETTQRNTRTRREVSFRINDGSPLVICGHCAQAILESRIGEHTHKVHPGAAVLRGTTETVALPMGKVRCPRCLSLVKSGGLARHLRNVCVTSASASPSDELPGRRPVSTLTEPDKDYEVENVARPEFLSEPDALAALKPTEGTKDVGISFRDHGQFGSPATFDSMDDESAP